ncbi:hypothetical protein [Veronia pacifica]|nr:hypothetical protein [Veronia pacifica]
MMGGLKRALLYGHIGYDFQSYLSPAQFAIDALLSLYLLLLADYFLSQ